MVLGDIWSSVGAAGSVAAAGAALVAVLYARSTVREARVARKEAADAHRELMVQEREALGAMQSAHALEMAARNRALDADFRLHRLARFDRVIELLLRIGESARQEHLEPPPIGPSGQPLTRLPMLLKRLSSGLAVLKTLGSPDLLEASALAQTAGVPALTVMGKVVDSLYEAESLARNSEEFQLDDGD